MNKAEKMLITEKFEAVILGLEPEMIKDRFVINKQIQAFRGIIKAL